MNEKPNITSAFDEEIENYSGHIIRTATEYKDGDYETVPSKIYPAGYFLEKRLEYNDLMDKISEAEYKVISTRDGFKRISVNQNEVYKVETELYKNFKTRRKIIKAFHRKKATLEFILVIQYLGQYKTCRDIAEETRHNVDTVQEALKDVKKCIITNFNDFECMKNLKSAEVIRAFYTKYSDYINELVKLI